MKKHEDLTESEIEKILIEQYDLGFLLKQIRNNKKPCSYWLPFIDAMRFITQFIESVEQIRNDLQINPTVITKNLCQLCGKDSFLQFITISKEIGRGINFPDPDDIKLSPISVKINDWKQNNYPTLSVKVAALRLRVLGKTPHVWQEAIEDYILFEKIHSTPLIYRRQGAEINVKQDDKTREYYIEIKIYADTDIRYFPKIIGQFKKFQKTLPAYCNPNEWDQNLVIARFMQYVLRRHLKLTQKQTLDWLKKHNLITPDYQHASQELRRFEELFMLTRRK